MTDRTLFDGFWPEKKAMRPKMQKTRDRSKEGLGKSRHSWKKHYYIEQIMNAYAAVSALKRAGRGIAIDMHSGDGDGVNHGDPNLFGEIECSKPSPAILCDLSKKHGNFDVLLCENEPERRKSLEEKFHDTATILDNHAKMEEYLTTAKTPIPYWGLVICDPCGPEHFGWEYMQSLCNSFKFIDFVIVFPHSGIKAPLSLPLDSPKQNIAKAARTGRERYEWMLDFGNLDRRGEPYPSTVWADILGRRNLVCSSRVIAPSGRFHYRVMVASNFLPDITKRWIRGGFFTSLKGMENENYQAYGLAPSSQKSAARSA